MRARKYLEASGLDSSEDWVGNVAAFTCPACANVFVVSQSLHTNGRDCPQCSGSRGFVLGSAGSHGRAHLDWTDSRPE